MRLLPVLVRQAVLSGDLGFLCRNLLYTDGEMSFTDPRVCGRLLLVTVPDYDSRCIAVALESGQCDALRKVLTGGTNIGSVSWQIPVFYRPELLVIPTLPDGRSGLVLEASDISNMYFMNGDEYLLTASGLLSLQKGMS